MSPLVFYLTLPLLYLISYLPLRALYLLSDFLYLIIYKVFAYRKKVTLENLRNSFPEKSPSEINDICREYYRYLCDLIVETLKTLTISPTVLKKHIHFDGISIFERYYAEKQSIIIVMGHLGNWELGGACFSQLPAHQLFVIYHPLKNQHFDKLINKMRTRLGNGLYPMKESFRGILKNRNKITATAFIADQTPGPENAHWMSFLNQDTAVFRGTEVISKKLDYPVVYVSVIREERGKYTVHSELLIEHPAELPDNELTEMHTKRLEQDIVRYPTTWLWSHRRWKHKRKTTE